MFKNILQRNTGAPKKPNAAWFLLQQSNQYLVGLQQQLDAQIDRRLVRTFFDLFIAILTFRNRSMGLLLSELGGYICGFDRAPAGTKRISNLLRSPKWKASLIDNFLFEQTKDKVTQLRQQGKRPLMLWDDSRLEKPESWLMQGLCSVWSSKGKRLTKIKRGYFSPPVSRICVPGFQWTAILLSSLGGTPRVCQMCWWTTRGKFKEDGNNIVYRMLKRVHQQIGRAALHVLDRGYASAKMLAWFIRFEQDFLIRWKTSHLLINQQGLKKKTHLVGRSCRPRQSQLVWDKERKKHKRISIAWSPVTHPEFPGNQLFLVVVRDKNTYRSPMYLITSLSIQTAAQAWECCFAYMHRWNIEQAFRFGKSALAMESPRLWFWDNRLKLLAIATLVYDFLLRMLQNWSTWSAQFFRRWCHRTGNRYRNASIPIYRLRQAISNCLFFFFAQNSG